jgi:hypothetical protein
MLTSGLAEFRLPAWLCVSVLVCGLVLQPASAERNDSVEIQVKAAYLLHFARYVYWPKGSSADPSIPLVFGVLGRDPMVGILQKTVSGKTVNNRPIRVKEFTTVDQIDQCDILFVPRSESKLAQDVLAEVSGKPILTVSDKESFSAQGGMVEFLLVNDTIRFTINNQAVERAGLKLSSEFLRVAYSIAGRRK